MAFCVRDPVFNATFPATRQRGHATGIRVKSRGYDAHLVRNQRAKFLLNYSHKGNFISVPHIFLHFSLWGYFGAQITNLKSTSADIESYS